MEFLGGQITIYTQTTNKNVHLESCCFISIKLKQYWIHWQRTVTSHHDCSKMVTKYNNKWNWQQLGQQLPSNIFCYKFLAMLFIDQNENGTTQPSTIGGPLGKARIFNFAQHFVVKAVHLKKYAHDTCFVVFRCDKAIQDFIHIFQRLLHQC